jgi:hypothetical protein
MEVKLQQSSRAPPFASLRTLSAGIPSANILQTLALSYRRTRQAHNWLAE